MPEQPLSVPELAALLRPLVLEHSTLCGHPGFMAYISGSGTVPGAAADLLAAGLNPNVGGWSLSPAATELELHLMRWLADRFGLPEGAGGLMTSGGAASNLTALKAARDARTDGDVRQDGVDGLRLVLYASARGARHHRRGGGHAGAGGAGGARHRHRRGLPDARRRAAAGASPTTSPPECARSPSSPRPARPRPARSTRCRRSPTCAPSTACGCTSTPPTAERPPWRRELRPLLDGIERADSIAFDPHKWLYTPQSSACLLVRDPRNLLRSYSIDAAYVRDDATLSGRGLNIGELGPQWSRAFLALKVWLSLAAHGTEAYGRRIAHDVELARYLDQRVRAHPDLEPMCPVTLSIACFRYAPAAAGLDDAALDALNERLMIAIRRDGRAFPSNAELGGRYCLRACLVNHRTEAADIDALVDATVELGAGLLAG